MAQPLPKRHLLIGILLCAFALHNPAADERKATEQQLNTLKKSIGELRGWLQGAAGKRSELQQQLRESELEIGRIAGKIKTVSREIQSAQNKLKGLQKKHQQLLNAQQQQERLLSRQIRAAYSIGRQEYLKVLLNQEQPDRVTRALTYYDYFNRARTKQIESYRQTMTELEQNELAMQQQTQKLEQSKAQLEQRRTALNAGKQKRSKLLLRLEGNIASRDEELKKLLADRKRLEQLLEAVEQTLAELQLPDAATPINQLKGRLPWPAQGKVARRFGSTDPLAKTRWNGILIAASEGEEVTAVHHGRVVFADWLRGFGLLIIVDHGKGYMSLYGHNQTLYKETGDWVSANQVIASVGSSGGRKNSGLYFEIRRNGQPQNPQQWIVARR